MAETTQKRLREESHHLPETHNLKDSNTKRQKPYSNIFSLLEEEQEQEQEDQNQDLSAIFTTLEQELSSSSTTFDFDLLPFTVEDHPTTTTAAASGGADESVESVMRHLLEASDDELGIPNTVEINPAENFEFRFDDEGLWEFENYYSVLQSELFM